MNHRVPSFLSRRLSNLTFLLTLIACMAGFAPAQQTQSAHFSCAFRIPGGTAAEARRKALSAQVGVSVTPDIQTTHGDFGPANVGSSSATPVAMMFTFDASVTLGSTAVLTQGATGLDFADGGGGTCAANTTYNNGDTCTVNVTFKPRAPGPRYGAAELLDTSGNLLATGYVEGTGVGPQAVFANTTSGVYLPSAQTNLGSGFYLPIGVAVDASGNVFVADTHNWAVKEIVAVNGSIPASPTIKTLVGGFAWPWRVAVDGAGNLFVSTDLHNGIFGVYEIVAAGGYTIVKTVRGFAGPANVAVDGSGNLFVAEFMKDGGVYEVFAAGGYTNIKTLGGGFSFPCGVAVDGSGNVFVADSGHGAVKEILAAGGYTTIKSLGSGFTAPLSVAVDGSENVFVADYRSHAVYEIVAAGGYTTVNIVGSGFDPSDGVWWDGSPDGVAVDGSGNVFVADYGHSRVVRLDFTDPPTLTLGKTSVGVESSDSPQTVTVSNVGNAALTFPIPGSGRNPSISKGFTLDSATTCPDLSISSATGKLAKGASCDYAVDFIPVPAGSDSGSLTLTDNNLNASPAVMQTISLAGTTIGPHLALSTPPPASLQSGQGPGTVAVSVENSNNDVITTSSATITLTVHGPSSYSKVYSVTASSGVATFSDLAVLSTVGAYTYTATDVPDGLTQAVASESVWTPHLAFTTAPPANLSVGKSPATVVVSVENASNNVMTTSSATITLRMTGPNSYTKAYTATAASGAATFSSLAVLKTEGSYTYTASDVPDGFTKAVATESVTWPPPFGSLDRVADNVTFSTTVGQSDSFRVRGWVADQQDGAPLSNVTVYVDGTSIGAPTLELPRATIAAEYGDAFLNSGYLLLYPAASLSLGKHKVTVVAIDSGGRSTTLGPRIFTVATTAGIGSPFGAIGVAVDSVT
ncbi:MAG TPA: NHL repeat-containing protein, partial [Terracidiphilus sp.]